MTKLIKKTLDNIAEQVEQDVRYVNCGGCAVYAVELAKRLSAIGINDYKFRVYGYSDVNVSRLEKELRKNNENSPPKSNSPWAWNDVNFSHVRLEWKGKLWDVEGSQAIRNGKKWGFCVMQKGEISFEALSALLPMQSNWNTMFKRRTQVPKMRKIMDKHFEVLSACN